MKIVFPDGHTALMPYLMAGFPDAETSIAVANAYVEAGADLIEIGVPFSDPLADGPVIHEAATRALTGGATLQTALDVCASVADRVPAVLMCYANMVLATGATEFAERLAAAGGAGAIVPDLPLGEDESVREALVGRDLAMIPLVAPTTPPDRRKQICESATGSVYVVSDTGVTGERGNLPASLKDLVAAVRNEAKVPAAVGFGISTPDQAAEVARIADGVIIGSKLIRLVDEGGVDPVREFLTVVKQAL
jgi:tryptophan synthase alpha chain